MTKVKNVSVEELFVDERYQRDLEKGRVKRMVEGWDRRLLGVLEVSYRNGTGYAVFDGQHRLEALRQRGEERAPCVVHNDLSEQEEAHLFSSLQRQRRNLSSLQRFKAQLFAENPESLAIQEIAQKNGYEIAARDHTTKTAAERARIEAVVALEQTYRRSPQLLDRTLGLIRDLWYQDEQSTISGMIQGTAMFLQSYDGRIGEEQLRRLRAMSPVVILRRASAKAAGQSLSGRSGWIMRELAKVAGVRGRPKRVKTLPWYQTPQ